MNLFQDQSINMAKVDDKYTYCYFHERSKKPELLSPDGYVV
jgi:hypothetical protein